MNVSILGLLSVRSPLMLMLDYLKRLNNRNQSCWNAEKMSLSGIGQYWCFPGENSQFCGYLLPLFLASERNAGSPQRQGVKTWPGKQTASGASPHLLFPGIYFV